MNDRELADKIVALGVGIKSNRGMSEYSHDLYDFPSFPYPVCANVFIRDPRVAMTMMERGTAHFMEKLTAEVWAVRSDKPYGKCKTREWYENESLSRAIIEAAVEALS